MRLVRISVVRHKRQKGMTSSTSKKSKVAMVHAVPLTGLLWGN